MCTVLRTSTPLIDKALEPRYDGIKAMIALAWILMEDFPVASTLFFIPPPNPGMSFSPTQQ
jgi:hypothetical protein